MIVVSDTSPIRYLILIRAIDVLPTLFGEVLIPPTVAAELSHAKTPEPVRTWFQTLPAWVKVQTPLKVNAIERLDPGEVEAIALALELDADRLLIDDNAGKKGREATRRQRDRHARHFGPGGETRAARFSQRCRDIGDQYELPDAARSSRSFAQRAPIAT